METVFHQNQTLWFIANLLFLQFKTNWRYSIVHVVLCMALIFITSFLGDGVFFLQCKWYHDVLAFIFFSFTSSQWYQTIKKKERKVIHILLFL